MSLKFKSLNDGTIQIEGVGIPFGGPVNGKDLHGQFFSTKTDFAWDLIPDGHRPLLYQHGLDDTLKTNVIGRWSVKKVDDKGVWITAQLNARAEYLDEIKELISADSLGLSSATMGHLVKVSSKSGEILRWPVVEMSLTPNPANPHAYVVKTAAPVEAVEYVAEKLAVLKYSEDQARDEHGRFGSGGGGGGGSSAGQSGRTIHDQVALQKVDAMRRSIRGTGKAAPQYRAYHQELNRLVSSQRYREAVNFAKEVATEAYINGHDAFASATNDVAAAANAAANGGRIVRDLSKSLKADTVYAEGAGLVDGLRDLLSDVVALYLESHGAHWNVVGDDFKQYHDLFGEIYEDVFGSIDPLAENIRKLNATAPFDLRDIASDPALNNASGAVNPEDLCEELYASNSVLLMKILSCFNMATEAGEQGIANFLAERQDAHKKWAWQLSASLDERGEQTEVEEAAESPELELDMSKSAKYSEDQARDGSGRFGSGGGSSSTDQEKLASGDRHAAVASAARDARSGFSSVAARAKGASPEDKRTTVIIRDKLDQIISRHEYGASEREAGTSIQMEKTARDISEIGSLIGRMEDSDLSQELSYMHEDLQDAFDARGDNKSFNVDPITDESAQPVVRLAIKAGTTTERKAADPDEVKKQMRALARDLAIKSVRK